MLALAGDGGPATNAELNDPTGIAVGPNGGLYIADSGNNRVREVLADGTIRTVAGSGQAGWVRSGTPALRAALAQPTAVAFGPGGQLYVATENEILRLGRDGRFVHMAGIRGRFSAGVSGQGGPATNAALGLPSGLGVARDGSVYVSGSAVKTLDLIQGGILTQVSHSFYPHAAGGITDTPTGAIFATDSMSVVRLTPRGPKTVLNFRASARYQV